jgi:PAS domain S-box-containing protein
MAPAFRPHIPVAQQRTVFTMVFAVVSLVLLAGGQRNYPNLHTILDTAASLLSSVLAWLLWDMGMRSGRRLQQLLAICFAATAAAELVHVLVTIEWTGLLNPIKQAEMELRPSTWPAASYVLPVGVLMSVLRLERRSESVSSLFLTLVGVAVGTSAVVYLLPRYTDTGVLGITRPTLLAVPFIWVAVGWVSWQRRSSDPALTPLAYMSIIMALAGAGIVYSTAPHDGPAMVAHAGKVIAYSMLLMALVDMLMADTAARITAERTLGDLNAQLERRVIERTAQLAEVNASLRVSEARTRSIIETALDAVVTIDVQGRITGWSVQAVQTFGWPREMVIGRPLIETILPAPPRGEHELGLALARYLETGESELLNRRLETLAVDRRGREFPIELSIAALRIDNVVSFSAFIRDITERTQTQQALLESRRHYQALSESMPNLVWTCKPSGVCDFISRQWVDYTGKPAELQLDYGWLDQVHPDDRDRVVNTWRAAVKREDAYDIEFRIRRADGVYRWFRTRALPLRDSRGYIVKWFGSNTDVDDDKHAEQRLRAQVERLALLDRLTRAIAERQDLPSILDVAIHSLETELPVDFCCACSFDRAHDRLVVTRIGAQSGDLARAAGVGEDARIHLDGDMLTPCVDGQVVYGSKVGEPGTFSHQMYRAGLQSLVAAPLLVERQVVGVLIVARRAAGAFTSEDCEFLRQLSEHVALAAHQAQLYSALKSAYDELRQTQQAVMQQERLTALGQMASGIAHDINNALSPVALYTESLLRTEAALTPNGREYLATIQRAVEDVAQTVGRMREFYRQREPQLVLLPVDVNRVLGDVLHLTRARWSDMPQQRGIVVHATTDLAPDEPTILAIESELREALINLIFNAVDALPDGGHLVLRSRMLQGEVGSSTMSSPRQVAIEVSDTGIGMDAETVRRCLEPFFTTKGERGTGLGLAMVYGMTRRNRADIDISSVPGSGTTMRLTFAAADRVTVDAAPEPATPHRSLRILAIDDDPLLLKSLSDTLGAEGHIVAAAHDGQAGIELFRQASSEAEPFDVVITDLGMPHLDGRRVATTIKEQSPHTRVILLTGWGSRLLDAGEIPATIDCVLSKPPKLSELRNVLASEVARET